MTTHYGIYLTNSSNKTIELPIAPTDFVITTDMDGTKDTVLGLGEVERLGKAKLVDFEIPSTLPLDPKHAPWCTAKKLLKNAQAYITWIESARKKAKPIRVVLSGTKINKQVYITSFEYGFKSGNTIEYAYTLKLTEYRSIKAIKTVVKAKKKKKVAKKAKPRSKPPKKIGVGSIVIVNGRLHRDSYGSGPGLTEHNATRKINFTAPGRKYPYHVTLLNGGWRGWVTAGSVKAK